MKEFIGTTFLSYQKPFYQIVTKILLVIVGKVQHLQSYHLHQAVKFGDNIKKRYHYFQRGRLPALINSFTFIAVTNVEPLQWKTVLQLKICLINFVLEVHISVKVFVEINWKISSRNIQGEIQKFNSFNDIC